MGKEESLFLVFEEFIHVFLWFLKHRLKRWHQLCAVSSVDVTMVYHEVAIHHSSNHHLIVFNYWLLRYCISS